MPKQIVLTFALLCSFFAGFGQSALKIKQSTIIVTIDFDQRSIITRGLKEIALKVSEFPSNSLIAPYKEYDVSLDTVKGKSRFYFVTDKPLYLNIAISQKSPEVLMNRWDNVYMLQPGDSINCHVINGLYIFSGKGSAKLNCQSELFKCINWSTLTEIDLLNQKKYDDHFNEEDSRLDSILNIQIGIVQRYQKRLTPQVRNILLANCYGLRYYMQLHVIINYSSLNPEAFLAYVNSESYKKMNLNLLKHLTLNELLQSPIYTDALFEKISINNIANETGQLEKFRSDSVRTRTFRTIMTHYQGNLRQKLLLTYLLSYKYSDISMFWPEIMAKLQNSEYLPIFLKLIAAKKKGAPFFPFELQNAEGNFVKTADLKDKVVILDFWYTGCENCIFLNQAMLPVIERFKNEPRVAFVSISIDNNKLMWLKSVASRMYTHDKEINLYTNGLGYHYPLLQYYNVTGFPTLFVLKNGTMFDPTPDRPVLNAQGQPTTTGGTGRFIEIIEKALIN